MRWSLAGSSPRRALAAPPRQQRRKRPAAAAPRGLQAQAQLQGQEQEPSARGKPRKTADAFQQLEVLKREAGAAQQLRAELEARSALPAARALAA
jgi:hypothetical protein